EPRVQALIHHFDDLDRAHQAVLKAKAQIAALEPLIADVDRHAALVAELDELRQCREALRPWFAELKSALLTERIAKLDADIERWTARANEHADAQRTLAAEREAIRRAISDNGGDRIEQLKAEISQLEERQAERRRRAELYAGLARQLDLHEPGEPTAFAANRREAEIGRAHA